MHISKKKVPLSKTSSVVKYYNHYEPPVYTSFLDASKALGRINHCLQIKDKDKDKDKDIDKDTLFQVNITHSLKKNM